MLQNVLNYLYMNSGIYLRRTTLALLAMLSSDSGEAWLWYKKKIQYEIFAVPRSNNLPHLNLIGGELPKLSLNLKMRYPAS